MLEFLLEPFIDTYFFGCPDSCIVPNSDTHELLKMLFTPLVVIGVSIATVIGTLFALRRRLPNLRSLRSRKGKSIEKDSPQTEEVVHNAKEPKTIKQFEKAIKKEKKNDFLSKLDEMERNPEIAFDKFLELQANHPQTESLEVARTEAKEEVKEEEPEVKMNDEKEQEFYINNKESLEKQAKQVTELMKSANITEDEAVTRIIDQMPKEPTEPTEPTTEPSEDVDLDIDIFKQDIVEIAPKRLKFFHKHFKKKEKIKYKFKLTELGTTRRNQYATQIESTLAEWVFPMPKYNGKNQEYQMEEGELKTELKKLSLFLSMGEMIADRKTKKKNYWIRTKIVR